MEPYQLASKKPADLDLHCSQKNNFLVQHGKGKKVVMKQQS